MKRAVGALVFAVVTLVAINTVQAWTLEVRINRFREVGRNVLVKIEPSLLASNIPDADQVALAKCFDAKGTHITEIEMEAGLLLPAVYGLKSAQPRKARGAGFVGFLDKWLGEWGVVPFVVSRDTNKCTFKRIDQTTPLIMVAGCDLELRFRGRGGNGVRLPLSFEYSIVSSAKSDDVSDVLLSNIVVGECSR